MVDPSAFIFFNNMVRLKLLKIKKTDVWSVLIPLLFGVLSMIVWLIDIFNNVGWNSLIWLNHHLLSVYIITALTVGSFLFPILLKTNAKLHTIVFIVFALYIIALCGFFICKYLFIELYAEMPEDKHVWHVWILIIIVTVVAAAFFYLKEWYLYKSGRFHIMTLVAVFISVVPASLITIEWFQGYGNAVTFVDEVKMGYPMLWVNIFLGWTAYAIVNKVI